MTAGARWAVAAAGAAFLVAGGLALVARATSSPGADAGDYRLQGGDEETARAADWAWFRAQVQRRAVAYTGTNLAFPLTGRDLANRVSYVNVAGDPGDLLHDFGRRSRRPVRAPTPEPAPYREGASYRRLAGQPARRGRRAAVCRGARRDRRAQRGADGDGFPIERAWADAHPALFSLRCASPDARIYGIAPP